MKIRKNTNGFTLIELLAVILILGIIALIAIPSVNSVINQSKKEAFRVSSDNIAKGASTNCQTLMISGQVEAKTYDIVDNEVVGLKLEVTGKLPKSGFISINEKCEVSIYAEDDSGNYVAYKDFKDERVEIYDKGTVNDSLINNSEIPIYAPQNNSCFLYENNSTGVTITGYKHEDESCSKDVVIPTSIGGKNVTAIKEFAFIDPESIIYYSYYIEYTDGKVSMDYLKYDKDTITKDDNKITLLILKKGTEITGYTCSDSSGTLHSEGADYNHTLDDEYLFCQPSANTTNSVTYPYTLNSIDFSHAKYLTEIPRGVAANMGLTSIKIGNYITKIGAGAFKSNGKTNTNANSITSIDISNNLKIIGGDAFFNNNITSLDLKNVEKVGPDAFYHSQIDDIKFGIINRVEHFTFAVNLIPRVDLPNTVTAVGSSSFYNNKIQYAHIPGSVKRISSDAFYNGDNRNDNYLTSLVLDNGVEFIGYRAFGQCNLTSLNIPGSVKTISRTAFAGCGVLSNLVLNEGLESIGYYAFNNDNSIGTINIPNSVKTISGYAFNNCNASTLNLGSGVETIGEYAFNHNRLTNIVIPDSVTSISSWAFGSPLGSSHTLTIGSGLKTIGKYAFDQIKSDTINIPDNVEEISEGAFRSKSIKTVNIGSGIKTIHNTAFTSVTGATININKASGSVANSPWGATSTTVNWLG